MPLYIERRPSGIYRIRGTHHGIAVNKSTGSRDERAADAIRESVERQIFEAQVFGKRAARSFAEAAEDYLIGGGEARYIIPLIDHFGMSDVAALRQDDLDRAAAKLHPRSMPSTVNRQVHTPFIAIMRLAADNDYCAPRRWRRPKQPEGRTDWRLPDEIDTLFEHLQPRMVNILTFMLGSYCRASEAIDLLHRDVSPDARRATFWLTKGNYARSVDLPPRAREAILRAREDGARPDAHVFLSDRLREPWADHRGINHTLARVCDRQRIKPISCHVMRHTGATWRYAMTRDLDGLMRSGGWKSLAMVQRYVHAGTPDLAELCTGAGWSIDVRPEIVQGEKRNQNKSV